MERDSEREVVYRQGMETVIKIKNENRHWWLTPTILATQEAEVRRITVRSQPGEIVQETLS
jgi:hypothetical protein